MNPFGALNKKFSVIGDENASRFFVIAQVDEKTARRAATSLSADGEDELVGVIVNALNLHAMPRLLRSPTS